MWSLLEERILSFVFVPMIIQAKALYMLGKYCPTELHSQSTCVLLLANMGEFWKFFLKLKQWDEIQLGSEGFHGKMVTKIITTCLKKQNKTKTQRAKQQQQNQTEREREGLQVLVPLVSHVRKDRMGKDVTQLVDACLDYIPSTP